MDERTLEKAQATTARLEREAIAQGNGPKTYSVIVLGRDNNRPFTVTASNADERAREMMKAGVDLINNNWGAGYIDRRRGEQICGNDEQAKRLVLAHLRRR